MFSVTVPDLVIRESMRVCNQVNFGSRGFDSDGTKEQQLNGIIAQNSIALAFGFPFVTISNTWDGGYDFVLKGQKFDVKTMTRRVDPQMDYEMQVVTSQLRYDVNAYLFTSYNTRNNSLTVCGWLTKDVFLNRARVFKRGDVVTRGDGTQFVCRLNTHQVYLHQLNHLAKSFDELRDDLEIYALLC